MALWTGLGQAATVAQLVGADVGGLISMIMQAALTARQNRKECEQLARRVLMIAELLPHLQDPEAVRQLAGLGATLREAHELILSCQGRSAVYQIVMAGRQAERFREVQSKIDFYLILFPVISHIGITRRLERIYNVLVQQDDSPIAEPSQLPQSSTQLQEVPPHKFSFGEIMAATDNFNPDTLIGEGGFGTVYRCRLQDGREVAVKRIMNLQSSYLHEKFRTELDILSRLRHKHIIRLLGTCVQTACKDKRLLGSCVQTACKDKRLQTTTLKKKKGLLTRLRKEPEELEGLIVYEYMENGPLFNHLHLDETSSPPSPVTVSWMMRIDVLLGVSRAIEHLQPIIHRDIKSANILLDASWVPRLSDFGGSVASHMASEKHVIHGTLGYLDPEYHLSGCVKPTSDLYSLGVVMLEVLTGKTAIFLSGDEKKMLTNLPSLALPIIEAGNLGELLDKRPVPKPTPGQLRALEQVAQTAVRCVQMEGKDRPAISDIVVNLEKALELIRRDEPSSS